MLYGDGIHDDTRGIQDLLDSGSALVELPMPREKYLISGTLIIHSHQELKLPDLAVIRLMDGSNREMLKNEAFDGGEDRDIIITGGIWDYNNRGQLPHPWHFPHEAFPDYNGMALRLRGVRNLRMRGTTLKDPMTFAVELDTVQDFTVEDIRFDFNYGNPWAINMDGIHLNGNCHYGAIRNLHGACYDDMVALNADEGTKGPISHIDIDGIFARDSHSAVRLLSVEQAVRNVHIRNVYGTYYQYCVGVTRYYDGAPSGFFDGLVLENIFAAKARRLPVYRKDGTWEYPLIWIEGGTRVKNMRIANLFRTETNTAVPTVYISEGARVENLIVDGAVQENCLGVPFPLIESHGAVRRLACRNVRADGDAVLCGEETIERIELA